MGKGNSKPAQYRCRASLSIIRGKDGEGSYSLVAGQVLDADRCAELLAEGILFPEHLEPIEDTEPVVIPDESERE